MSASAYARVSQTQSDERLAAAAGEGDETAFEALVLRYRQPLLCYSRRLGLSEARAEDVAQQSLMRAWISLQHGVAVLNVSAWLYRIAHNATIDALRGSARSHEQLTEVATEIAAVNGDPERAIALREIFADLAALPNLQREALLCIAVEGRSNEQAALALGVTSGAVRGLVYRARATLRAAAGAVTPPSVLGWVCAAGRRGSRLADRVTTVEVGGAGAGVATGGLIKAGAAMLAAGAIAVGVTAVRHAPTGSGGLHRPRHGAAAVARRTRGVGSSAPLAASHAPSPGASRGAHARGGVRSGSPVRSAAQTPPGSGSPAADGRELATALGDGSGTSATSRTTLPAAESAPPQRRVGGVGSAPPVSGSHGISAPPVPPRKGGNQGPGGSGGSNGSPNLVSINSGGGEGAGQEVPAERGASGGGVSAENPESSGGHETSTPPKQTAPTP
jgi:RNA polymerase sigma factor (sigma-70 family)